MRQADLRVRRGIGHALPLGLPALAALVAVSAAACGSRGPLDVDVVQVVGGNGTLDAGTQGGNEVDSSPGPVVDSAASRDTGAAVPEAGLLGCGVCVAQQCGTAITTCLADTTCRTALTCIATTCLAGGDAGGGTSCLLGCAGGNPLGLVTTLGPILTCITQTCGADCGGVLGGLGGIPGLGGSVVHVPQAHAGMSDGQVIFSQFPELCSER